jgi:hypothetical protein
MLNPWVTSLVDAENVAVKTFGMTTRTMDATLVEPSCSSEPRLYLMVFRKSQQGRKVVSDTPRTDDQIGYDGSTMTLIRIEFARQLERELNAVTKERDIESERATHYRDKWQSAEERIKRLVQAGDCLLSHRNSTDYHEKVREWDKAKRDKP